MVSVDIIIENSDTILAVAPLDASILKYSDKILFDDDDKKKLQDYSCEKRQVEWLTVRYIANRITGKNLKICYKDEKKPYITNSDYNISISHSKSFAAVLLHRKKQVGIDVEYISDRIHKIEDRFLSSEEINNKYRTSDEVYYLFLLWSAKEAIYKIMNIDSLSFKDHIRIFPFEVHDSGQFGAQVKYQHLDVHFEMRYMKYKNNCLVWSIH